MKYLLKLEEFAQFACSIALIGLVGMAYPWWMYILLFLAPDLGILGYFLGPQIGSICYNVLHHKAVAILLALAGFLIGHQFAFCLGLMMFAHSSFDRMLGFGMKYPDNFKNTHLGMLP